jgi:hypothetical protein
VCAAPLAPVLCLALLVTGATARTAAADPAWAETYPWLADWAAPLPPLRALEQRFAAPAGHSRVPLDPGTFGAWLRGLPVRLDRDRVLSHRGGEIAAPAAAVVALDVGAGDLQQCADTVIRLHAEHLWSAGRGETAAYHLTNGDLWRFSDWVRGEILTAEGSRVTRSPGPPRAADHRSFRRWLQRLFVWAGTRSLATDSRPLPPGEAIRPGDLFLDPGGPGHAVLVLDVAVPQSGPAVALLGQGFMPAQELHVLRGRGPGVLDGVWFTLPETPGETLATPSWGPFPRSSARRLAE